MQVQPAAESGSPEPLSHIEMAVQGLVRRIRQLVEPLLIRLGLISASSQPEPVPEKEPAPLSQPSPDFSFETKLLSRLQIGSIAPPMVLRHFERHVSLDKQAKIFERLGREAALPFPYRIFYALESYQTIGMNQAQLNPYLVAPYLEKALRKKIGVGATLYPSNLKNRL